MRPFWRRKEFHLEPESEKEWELLGELVELKIDISEDEGNERDTDELMRIDGEVKKTD